MLVSVVSVCYNNRAGLEDTWASVRSQGLQNWEWIVVDGASTDGTVDFLRSLEDARVSWKSEKDSGIYDAMNRGLDQVKGDYVTFLNSGDLFRNADVLEEVAQFVNANGQPDLCYGDASEKTSGGDLLTKKALPHRLVWYGMFTHHQAMFYRCAFVGAQRYPTHYQVGGDYAFTAEVLARGAKAAYLPRVLCIFEKGGLSERSAAVGRADVWTVQKEILRLPLVSRLGIRLAQLAMHRLKHSSPILYRVMRFRRNLKKTHG